MYIDADCHVSSREVAGEVGIKELVRRLDQVGVDKAIAWPMVSYTKEMASDNKVIYEGAQEYVDRIIPFGGVNPRLGIDLAIGELRRCIEQYDMQGVKLNGARDGFFIDDPELSLPLIEMIDEAGIVLALHCGSNDFERTHPFRIAKISEQFPELSIMVIHMGGAGQPALHDSVIEFAQQYPQWYLVDSEADYRKVHEALEVIGPERLCYGSDTPFCPMRFEWDMRQVIYQDLSKDERDLVLGGNMARLLGIEGEAE